MAWYIFVHFDWAIKAYHISAGLVDWWIHSVERLKMGIGWFPPKGMWMPAILSSESRKKITDHQIKQQIFGAG
jgi:hypothetical protein